MGIGSHIGLRRRALGAAAVAALFCLPSGGALASPQALGLVATKDATPLQCDAEGCEGFFSTFCLEKDRNPPTIGTVYRPTESSEVTLIVETGDGRKVTLPGADYLSFNTRLDHTSVLAEVPMSRIAAMAPVRVSVQVGALASLVPVSVPGDKNHHSAEALETATGPRRMTGVYFFETAGETADTVSLVTRMINAMPRHGRATDPARDAAVRTALQEKAVPAARERFRSIVHGCRSLLEATARINMRDCLQYRHKAMQTETNRAFWKASSGV